MVMRFGKRIAVRFGEPIPCERYQNRFDQAIAPRQLTDDLMYEIAQLSGQTYVDLYAASVKAKAAAALATPPVPATGEGDEGRDPSRVPGTRAS